MFKEPESVGKKGEFEYFIQKNGHYRKVTKYVHDQHNPKYPEWDHECSGSCEDCKCITSSQS